MKALLAALLALGCVSTSAEPQKIAAPEFARGDGINEFQKKRTAKLLEFMRDELEFIRGTKIGQVSNQHFGGTSEAVGGFLSLLYQASAEPITVEFQDLGPEKNLAIILHQYSDASTVIVNLSRDDFRLRHFRGFLPGSQSSQQKNDPALKFLQSLQMQKENDPTESAKIGRELAENDLKAGRPRVFYYGKPWSAGKPFIDDQSGLKVSLAAGCVIGARFRHIVEAYNGRMREAAAGK